MGLTDQFAHFVNEAHCRLQDAELLLERGHPHPARKEVGQAMQLMESARTLAHSRGGNEDNCRPEEIAGDVDTEGIYEVALVFDGGPEEMTWDRVYVEAESVFEAEEKATKIGLERQEPAPNGKGLAFTHVSSGPSADHSYMDIEVTTPESEKSSYEVGASRVVHESTTLEVEAESREEAVSKVRREMNNIPLDEWSAEVMQKETLHVNESDSTEES